MLLAVVFHSPDPISGDRQGVNEKSPQPAAEPGDQADLAGFNPRDCPDHSPWTLSMSAVRDTRITNTL